MRVCVCVVCVSVSLFSVVCRPLLGIRLCGWSFSSTQKPRWNYVYLEWRRDSAEAKLTIQKLAKPKMAGLRSTRVSTQPGGLGLTCGLVRITKAADYPEAAA